MISQVVDYRTVDVFKEMAKRGQQFDVIYDTVAAGATLLMAACIHHSPTNESDPTILTACAARRTLRVGWRLVRAASVGGSTCDHHW